jgi:hypothetical protein
MMGRKSHDQPGAASTPDYLAGLRRGDVLCDRHRRECYQVTSIDGTRIGLHRDGTDFFVPRSLFVSWHGRRLFPIEESRTIDTPDWCSPRRESPEADESNPRAIPR